MLFLLTLSVLALMIANADDLNESQQPRRGADVIFVLGAPAAGDGTPGDVMRTRVEKGVALFKAGYAPHMVLQGAAVSNEHVEAQVMADYARALGIDRQFLTLEENSRDTVQNVEEAVKLMQANGWRKAIVVTSPYHTRRVGRLFASHHVDVNLVAAAYPPDWGPLQRLGAILREYALLIWYRLHDDL